MREICLDTETTGLSRLEDRVIEIGCVEMVDRRVTGRTFHAYINPQREVHPEAFKVHGLSYEHLKKFPTFKRVVGKFQTFIGDATLVAHNAEFDLGMLNAELKRLELPDLTNPVIDTLVLSREVKRGGRHTLDSLMAHYGINASRRTHHGALLDAELLAEVYIELRGGRQHTMDLDRDVETEDETFVPARQRPDQGTRASRVTPDDLRAHSAFIATIKDPIWADYLEQKKEAA
jgi:DNA polymerase-3 subunit epsilon